jgi:hypothetical protein
VAPRCGQLAGRARALTNRARALAGCGRLPLCTHSRAGHITRVAVAPAPAVKQRATTRKTVRARTHKPQHDRWFDQLCAVLYNASQFGENCAVHAALRTPRTPHTWETVVALFNTHDRGWRRNVRSRDRTIRPPMQSFWMRCIETLFLPDIKVRTCELGRGIFAAPHASDATRHASILRLWACASSQADARPARSAFYFWRGERRFITGPLSLCNHRCVRGQETYFAFRQQQGEVEVTFVGTGSKRFKEGDQVRAALALHLHCACTAPDACPPHTDFRQLFSGGHG